MTPMVTTLAYGLYSVVQMVQSVKIAIWCDAFVWLLRSMHIKSIHLILILTRIAKVTEAKVTEAKVDRG